MRTATPDLPFAKDGLPLRDLLDPLDRIHVLLSLGHVRPATSAGQQENRSNSEAARGTEIDPGLEVQEPEILQVVIIGSKFNIILILSRQLLTDPENPLILNL